jgi:hypothetical protein
MVSLQIVERPGSTLYKTLVEAMRTGELRTFSIEKRGRKVRHGDDPGWMNWRRSKGVIACEVLSPRKPWG